MSKEKRLDSGVSIEKKQLSAVVGEDGPTEILGYATIYTVGDVLVPRDWLLDRMNELGLESWMAPKKTRPSSAYKRAMDRVITTENDETRMAVSGLKNNDTLRVELDMRDGGSRYEKHFEASVYFPEDEIGVDGGEWKHHSLGRFDYDKDTQGIIVSTKVDESEKPQLYEAWQELVDRAQALMTQMESHHNGQDLRSMAYKLTHNWTNAVPLRDGGAVYFLPAALSETIEGMSQLFEDVNEQYKTGGKKMAIRTIEVIDTEDKREWIQEQVEEQLDGLVDDALDEAFEMLSEDDETVESIARTVLGSLQNGDEMAEQYNTLLQAKLDVQEMLEKRKNTLSGDKEEIIDKVLSQQTF